MPKNSNRGRSNRDDWSVMEMARERPIAAAAAAAGAAAAGLFLWSKRSAISQQLGNISDQIGEWTEGMGPSGSFAVDDTAGLTTATPTKRSGAGSRSASGTRSTSSTRGRSTTAKRRGMSETGAGNASIGAHSGGMGTPGNG